MGARDGAGPNRHAVETPKPSRNTKLRARAVPDIIEEVGRAGAYGALALVMLALEVILLFWFAHASPRENE